MSDYVSQACLFPEVGEAEPGVLRGIRNAAIDRDRVLRVVCYVYSFCFDMFVNYIRPEMT